MPIRVAAASTSAASTSSSTGTGACVTANSGAAVTKHGREWVGVGEACHVLRRLPELVHEHDRQLPVLLLRGCLPVHLLWL